MLPGKHPRYKHALSDLRAARWFLNHQPSDSVVSAINEIKKESIDDGKDLIDYPQVDVQEHGSRLLKSMAILHKAHADVAQEEDTPELRGLRHAVLDHIDRANQAADHAHSRWLKEVRH